MMKTSLDTGQHVLKFLHITKKDLSVVGFSFRQLVELGAFNYQEIRVQSCTTIRIKLFTVVLLLVLAPKLVDHPLKKLLLYTWCNLYVLLLCVSYNVISNKLKCVFELVICFLLLRLSSWVVLTTHMSEVCLSAMMVAI